MNDVRAIVQEYGRRLSEFMERFPNPTSVEALEAMDEFPPIEEITAIVRRAHDNHELSQQEAAELDELLLSIVARCDEFLSHLKRMRGNGEAKEALQ